jgi:DNA helicase IV
VLGGGRPAKGAPLHAFARETALLAWLGARLVAQTEAEPRASFGVIVRDARVARRIAEGLRAHLPVRLVWGGEFRFAPGVDVTTVDQVRGLEFDHVIVPDASARTYGADGASRRALYIAVTRGRKSVVLAWSGAVSDCAIAPPGEVAESG